MQPGAVSTLTILWYSVANKKYLRAAYLKFCIRDITSSHYQSRCLTCRYPNTAAPRTFAVYF